MDNYMMYENTANWFLEQKTRLNFEKVWSVKITKFMVNANVYAAVMVLGS
jgi:hypothetical protein